MSKKSRNVQSRLSANGKVAIEKYHQDFNNTFNPFTDIAVKLAQNAKCARRKQ